MSLDDVKAELPAGAMITDALFESSDIVLFTKSKKFFTEGTSIIKTLVKKYRKRIEIRPDKSISIDEDAAKGIVKKLVPEDAGVEDIIFEPEFGRMIIYARKPGIVIGKHGSILNKIKEETCWLPKTKRVPIIDSKYVSKAREIIHENSAYRQKFLNKIGKQIQMKKGGKDGWVRVSFLGAAQEVGRSAILLQTDKSNVLMDCGVGHSEKTATPILNAPEFDIEKLDAVIISHAHMDHVGFLPYLYKYGYTGPVYMTAPTRDLSILLQLDYIKLMQNEGKNVPYTSDEIKKTIKHCIALNHDSVCDITPDMRLTFQNAGHILGSSLSHIHIGEGLHNLVYTGDFKYGKTRLFDSASTNFQRVETLIMESTYAGPKDSEPMKSDCEARTTRTILDTFKRKGKVIIPSFAVGRAQELMLFFEELHSQGKINCPIYLDGMIWDTTAIHTAHPEFLSRQLQKRIFHEGNNPFTSEIFKPIGSHQDREKVFDNEPAVIITTSGMVNGGPVIEYLKRLGDDKKNTFMFAGYQAEGTLGRYIQMGYRDLPIGGSNAREGLEARQNVRINLQVETAKGFGAHSTRNQLSNYIKNLKSRPNKILLNHGESRNELLFADAMQKRYKIPQGVVAPKNLDAIRLV